MSSCFSKTHDEITTSSDYIGYKRRKQIYNTMAYSLDPNLSTDGIGYLRYNRNYKVRVCPSSPGMPPPAPSTNYILAQSQSYAAYLDMVRGAKYSVIPSREPTHTELPSAFKYQSSLGSFLQHDSSYTPSENNCDKVVSRGMLPKGLIDGRYEIPAQLKTNTTPTYMQALRAQPTTGLFLHSTLAFTCPACEGADCAICEGS